MRLAIADPPYPPQYSERHDLVGGGARVTRRSRAQRWYGDGMDGTRSLGRGGGHRPADRHEGAGEWDHPARHRLLLEQLRDEYDGWAIATSSDGIGAYHPLPVPCRLMVWHKLRPLPTSHRIATSWEAVILYPAPGRRAALSTGQVPDVLVSPTPNRTGFAGAKPPEWTRWVLDALGYDAATDSVNDLFPGSGSVTAAIAQGVLL